MPSSLRLPNQANPYPPVGPSKPLASPPLRKLLGYHVDATELSVNTYSRDLLAPPLRELVPTTFTTLSKASQACLQWLGSCLKHSPVQALAKQPRLQGLAAADACAEGGAVTSSQMVWFAETWTMQDVRRVWPCLVKPAQRYIACFETLAQLALLQATHSHIGGGRYSFSMPSGTDNSAAEAGINKLGLCKFLCSLSPLGRMPKTFFCNRLTCQGATMIRQTI